MTRAMTLVPGWVLLAFTWLAFAQEPYPARAIRLIVSFTPGGGADLTARAVGAGCAISSTSESSLRLHTSW
jgi:tripartite-type tricarboxylate transporter receptor subunit TctC